MRARMEKGRRSHRSRERTRVDVAICQGKTSGEGNNEKHEIMVFFTRVVMIFHIKFVLKLFFLKKKNVIQKIPNARKCVIFLVISQLTLCYKVIYTLF